MQLTPRYGPDAVLVLDGPPSRIAAPLIRQRRRLAMMLTGLSDEQWSHPSRCDGWSCRDVIVHLESTNAFWSASISSGVGGAPTRFLGTFDPVASPAQMVAASDVSANEVLDRFIASSEALATLLSSLGDGDWAIPAEAPPGHISVSAVAHHALWDSWVHERDVLLPLGITPVEEEDEVAACLRYVAGLGPALAMARGESHVGTLGVSSTDPDLSILVEVGERVVVRDGEAGATLRLAGRAVDLVEAFSIRAPHGQPIPPDSAWMLGGLAATFDVIS
jgi:uncharacterized protein (TIGR03083 family)